MTTARHDLVPDEFLEEYEADTVAEALEAAKTAYSTTPRDEMKRCQNEDCRSVKIHPKPGREQSHRRDTAYWCGECGLHFDEPAPPRAEADEAGDPA